MNRTKQLQQLRTAQAELFSLAGANSPARLSARALVSARALLVRKRFLIPSLTLCLVVLAQPVFTGSGRTPEHGRIVEFIAATNPEVGALERQRVAAAIIREAGNLEIPAAMLIDGQPVHPVYFLAAMVAVESSFDRHAVSNRNAHGYMQLMPETVAWMKGEPLSRAELFDTETNIRLGVRYLNMLFSQFGTTRRVALAYNAGPGSVRRGIFVERYWGKVQRSYRHVAFGEALAAR